MEGGGRTGACPGERGPCPPLEMGKKMLSEEILTSFTYVLLKKVGCDRYTIRAKWMGVGGQVRVHGGRGWGPWPPLEIGKKRLSEEILISFTYILLHF